MYKRKYNETEEAETTTATTTVSQKDEQSSSGYSDSSSCSRQTGEEVVGCSSSSSSSSSSCAQESQSPDIVEISPDTSSGARKRKNVDFNGVTVFYFPRSQGFTCVPTQGGSTLGMGQKHNHYRKLSLREHAQERKQNHRDFLLQQRQECGEQSSDTENSEDLSDVSDSELEADSCYFLQPVPIKKRRAMLRASGVRKIDSLEKEDCRDIRASRDHCGCSCKIYCDPDTCGCSLAGIKCQVDRLSFPCGCTRDGCTNLSGRVEFNPVRVRTHFIHTLMRLEFEKKSEDAKLAASKMPLTNLNGQNSCLAPGMLSSLFREEAISSLLACRESQYAEETCSSPFSPDISSYSENSEYSTDDTEQDVTSKDLSKEHGSSEKSKTAPTTDVPTFNNFSDYSSEEYVDGSIELRSVPNGSSEDAKENAGLSPKENGRPERNHYTDLSSETGPSSYSGLLCSSAQEIVAIRPVSPNSDKPELLLSSEDDFSDNHPNVSVKSSGETVRVDTEPTQELDENFGEIIKKTMVETVSN